MIELEFIKIITLILHVILCEYYFMAIGRTILIESLKKIAEAKHIEWNGTQMICIIHTLEKYFASIICTLGSNIFSHKLFK